MRMGITPLENALMAVLLRQSPHAKRLEAQFKQAQVVSRDYSGAGFLTTFELPPSCPSLPGRDNETERLIFGDVAISSPDLEDGGGAMVYVEKGRLDCLEAYAHGDTWPERDLHQFQLNATTAFDHPAG